MKEHNNNNKLFLCCFEYLLIAALFFFTNINAQVDEKILEKKLASATGTERVDILNKLSYDLKRNSLSNSKKYAEEAYQLSLETDYQFGEGFALINLGFLDYTQNNLTEAGNKYKKALAIFTDLKNEKEIARTKNQIGLIYWRGNHFAEAFKNYREALSLADKVDAKDISADALNYMGSIYWKWSDYDKALDFFFQSLKLKEELGDKFEAALTLNNIAFIYNEMNQADQSLYYSNRVLEITKGLNDNYVYGRVYNNLGVSYFKKNELDKALQFQNESLRIKELANDLSGMAYSYKDVGDVWFAKKNYDEATKYYNLSLELRKKLKDKYGIASCLFDQAKVEKAKGNIAAAQSSFLQALNYSISIGNKRLEANCHYELSDIYKKLGNNNLAFNSLNKYSTILDSLLSKEVRNRVLELSVIYEVDAKDNELRIKNLEIEKEQNKQIYTYVVIILILAALTILYKRYSSVKVVKKQLEDVNKELEKKSKDLEDAIKARDKFFSIVSHDLKSPFFGLRSLSDILIQEKEDLSDEEKNEFIYKINKTTKEVYLHLENLLDWTRLQTKRMEYNPESFELREEVEQTIFLLGQYAEQKKIKLHNNVSGNIFVAADRRMIHSVIQNLISNAIKFTYEKGKVDINAFEEENFIRVDVADNGMGIMPEFKDKIFQIDSQTTSRGTNDEKGTGLGLLITKELIELNGGKISFTTKEEKGTTFTFTIPKAKAQL